MASESSLDRLTTEAVNPRSVQIDRLSALEIVYLMNAEDAQVAPSVRKEAPRIARAIECIADRMRQGGRLIYVGAGTSGRLGVLDASECPPTFRTPPEQVVGVIAGGRDALVRSSEGKEDFPAFGRDDLAALDLAARDAVVGIATSGRTPYVLGALEYARSVGAATIGISCTEDPELAKRCQIVIAPIVGPEVISGSTRLKAGTATKMVLNMLSTATMVLLGKTYGNLMVDLRATNTKLKDRARRIVMRLTDRSVREAEALLEEADWEVKTALVCHFCGICPAAARRRLEAAGGHVRPVLESGRAPRRVPDAPVVGGVDIGGTRTTAWIGRPDRTVRGGFQVAGTGQAGGGALRRTETGEALAVVRGALREAFERAGWVERPLDYLVIAAAGAGDAARRTVLADGVRAAGIAEAVEVIHDAEPLLEGAEPVGVGIAVIAGTGSLVYGQDEAGRCARAGGWGWWLGDPGSALDLARRALQCVLDAADHGAPLPAWSQTLAHRLGVPTPSDLLDGVYRGPLDPARLAGLAPVVLHALAVGDPNAIRLAADAAGDLADQVVAVARKLDWTVSSEGGTRADPSGDLVVTGSCLVKAPAYRQMFLEAIGRKGVRPKRVVVAEEPAEGALRRAARAIADR